MAKQADIAGALAAVPDDEDPSGAKLTPLQRRFADNIADGATNIAAAARAAGAAEKSAAVQGSRWLRTAHVGAYLRAKLTERRAALSFRAIETVARLLDAESEAVALRAAQDVLDRNGITSTTAAGAAGASRVSVSINVAPE